MAKLIFYKKISALSVRNALSVHQVKAQSHNSTKITVIVVTSWVNTVSDRK